jgi:Sulfotransferase domain
MMSDGVQTAAKPLRSFSRLVFIGSVGYSGSTLLDMILGANQGMTSLGEVAKLAEFYRVGAKCTCGVAVPRCPFWARVERTLQEEFRDTPDFSLGRFPLISQRSHRSIHRVLPTLAETLLLLGSRRIWNMASAISASVSEYRQIASNTLQLFDTVARLCESPVIVDSSKEPVKLKSLYLADPQRFYLVLLVRDGRAVTFSQMKHKNMDFEAAARRWARYNWNLHLVMKTIPRQRTLLVRYEDLCRDTEAEIARVLEFSGMARTVDFRSFQLDKQSYHNIGGNPMRARTGETKITLEESWKSRITAEQEALFQKVAGKWNRKFGYAPQAS